MSKNIKQNIIKKIESEQVTIRPIWVFYLGSVLSALGLVIASAFTLISIHLFRFRLTHPGINAARKIDFLLTSIPWYIPVLGVLGLVIGYLLLKQYDFSYRKNLSAIVVLILSALVLSSILFDKMGINDVLSRRGYFRQIYGQEQNWGQLKGPGFGQGRGFYSR